MEKISFKGVYVTSIPTVTLHNGVEMPTLGLGVWKVTEKDELKRTVNAAIFDFELSVEDMTRIDALNENRRIGADPDNFDF
jgi:diketogulonate reductase-like aldo/keto reductase